jgi:hypothetical protein
LMLDSIETLSTSVAEKVLDPIRLRGKPSSRERTPEFDEAVGKCFGRLDYLVSEAAIDRCFRSAAGVTPAWSNERVTGLRYVLFTARSALLTDPGLRARLATVAREAETTQAVQESFNEYLGWLTFGASERSSILSQYECAEILKERDLVGILWNAALAQPLNPRSAGTLRRDRQRLIASGIPEEQLPIPAWWEPLEAEFFVEE